MLATKLKRVSSDCYEESTVKILVLTDRDWCHPQGGGTGTNLYNQIRLWSQWGHSVTVVAGDYPGAEKIEQIDQNITVYRMGTRVTVFPKAAWAVLRGLGKECDVALEVINGIAFFTPLWLRKPHVALVHHIHRDHYVSELGTKGKLAAELLEQLPLKTLYRHVPFITISETTKKELHTTGVANEQIDVAYLGVDHQNSVKKEEAQSPTLLYLGRLKQYKRIEHILQVTAALPGTRLIVAGDGDHYQSLVETANSLDITNRVEFKGFVDEQTKLELYSQAWVNLTASSAEGWGLSVMEAAACGTPSVALDVGGLHEAIVDNETGLLAEDTKQLTEKVNQLVDNNEERHRLGAAAKKRSEEFTWQQTATNNLKSLKQAAETGYKPLRKSVARSETAKAIGLAAASLGGNVVALAFTVIFSRILGTNGYGSLATLLAVFITLGAPIGLALQVSTARETVLGRLGSGRELSTTLFAWLRHLTPLLLLSLVVSLLLKSQIADLLNVDSEYGSAVILPTVVLWMGLSVVRGVLQGLHSHAQVGVGIVLDPLFRLILGLLLVGLGLGTTGAFLGTALGIGLAAAIFAWSLRRRLGATQRKPERETIFDLFKGSWGAGASLLSLTLLAVLQNVDVIVAKRELGEHLAGSYAAASVAAKSIIWVAIGIGLHLLPTATKQAINGQNPRPTLIKAVAIVLLIAAPAVAFFAIAPTFVLEKAFGSEFTSAADALPILGIAMTALGVTYLTVQYLLALGRYSFISILTVASIVLSVLLTFTAANLLDFAYTVGISLIVTALVVSVVALKTTRPKRDFDPDQVPF